MRRIVMFNHVSADGHFAGADGNLDWVVPDPDIDEAAVEALEGFDTMLFGRKTYEIFEAFWPHALDESGTSPDPHNATRRSPALRALAVWINEQQKVVFSRRRTAVTWKHSRLLPALDTPTIKAMKLEPGKDIIVFGSGSIVSELTKRELIDEYQFVVNPVLLGEGRRLFSGLSSMSELYLLDAKTYPSGNVVLRYEKA